MRSKVRRHSSKARKLRGGAMSDEEMSDEDFKELENRYNNLMDGKKTHEKSMEIMGMNIPYEKYYTTQNEKDVKDYKTEKKRREEKKARAGEYMEV